MMGFEEGDIMSTGFNETTRKHLIGRAMDRNMMKWLGGILMAVHATPLPTPRPHTSESKTRRFNV